MTPPNPLFLLCIILFVLVVLSLVDVLTLLWTIIFFVCIVLTIEYVFHIKIKTYIYGLFQPTTDVQIDIETAPPSTYKPPTLKEVFYIADNKYTYEDAKAVCKLYDGELASYAQIEDAYNKGAEWCGYGWSKDQMALFPTQEATYNSLDAEHKHDCGRPGINGGYIDNPNALFGVNCFGIKPKQTAKVYTPYPPKTVSENAFDKKVLEWKQRLNELIVAPFNKGEWNEPLL